jgi:hypothetical protein
MVCFTLQYPGTVRLGADWSNTSYYVGKINCAALFNYTLIPSSNSYKNDYKDQCDPAKWTTLPTGK